MEDIIDADYAHTKRVCKGFEIKNLGEYQDLYVQSDTLLLPWCFWELSAPWLGWQAAFENIKVKRDLLSDIDTLLMVEKGIRGRKCHFIYGMQKLVTNESKIMIKDKESSYL